MSCLLTEDMTIIRDQAWVKRQTRTLRKKDEGRKKYESADEGQVKNESMWGWSQHVPSGQ